ncbi:MAG TPA: HNH endonuclease [Verrucomicrobiae bacterium]|jgi:hypothetical protein|nr:HNH endonuclease [Verrucomicrobiae bacterium]
MTTSEKEELDIQFLYRGEDLWQFRFGERTENYHTKSFSDSGRHSDESLVEARNYRNEFFKVHPEFLALRAPFQTQLPSNNRTGILGVNYSETTLPSGTIARGWQMTCPRPDSPEPATKKFSVRKHGETQALMMAVQARRDATLELIKAEKLPAAAKPFQHLIDEYDDIIAELQESIEKDSKSELLSIIQEAQLDATSKQGQIQMRLGQHRFRRLVIGRWQGCCAITGVDILVDAAHIKPWRKASNFDRINPYNGIALSPLYHRAFDLGYIAFVDDGSILVSEKYRERLLRMGMNLSGKISGLTEDHQPYLEHHRKHLFQENKSE